MIEVGGISKAFYGVRALTDCTLFVERESITGLIGPNGSGKSTLFSIINGFEEPDSGEIKLNGQPVTHFNPYQLVERGLVRTFQVPREFGEMTVLENMMCAKPRQLGERFWNVWINWKGVVKQEAALREEAMSILHFLKLDHLANEQARNLSGGQKKLLDLGRALMVEPQVLLMDEPFAGVNPVLAEQLATAISELRDRGLTFFVIEHNLDLLMDMSDTIWALVEGRVLAHGEPNVIRNDKRVLEAYLGVSV